MDFEKLKTFQQVAIDGSIVQAVKSLKMDKSSISRHLSQLEKQLGKPLFDRQGQKLILTHEGHYLLERANHILMEIEVTKSHLLSNLEEVNREFTISTTFAVASMWLSKLLHLFIDENPHIKLNIKATSLPLNLTIREADVAIRAYCNDRDDLIQKHLKTWRLNLYASKEYLAKFGMPQTIEDLDHHRFIILDHDPHVYPHNYATWPLTKETRKGKYRKSFLQINSVEGMYNLVKNGVGIGNFGSNFTYKDQLVPIFPAEMWFDIDIYLIYPIQFEHLEIIKKFENFLFTYINQYDPNP